MTTPFDDLGRALPGVEVLLDRKAVEPFGSDHLGFRGLPGAVVRPRSTEHVAALLALSAERGFAVVPRAAATNLCGSFVPRRNVPGVGQDRDRTASNGVRKITRISSDQGHPGTGIVGRAIWDTPRAFCAARALAI
jgi:hypothetical protein